MRINKYIKDKFSNLVNPKDGYLVGDFVDAWMHMILEFLVPIVYPEKPTRVTITVENTIFGALEGERLVD